MAKPVLLPARKCCPPGLHSVNSPNRSQGRDCVVKHIAQWKENQGLGPRAATVDRFLVLTHFSESGNREPFLEVSHITKGTGSWILARQKAFPLDILTQGTHRFIV